MLKLPVMFVQSPPSFAETGAQSSCILRCLQSRTWSRFTELSNLNLVCQAFRGLGFVYLMFTSTDNDHSAHSAKSYEALADGCQQIE